MKRKQGPKRAPKAPEEATLSPILREGVLLVVAALSVFFLVALGSFNDGDPSWVDTGHGETVHNAAGYVGANVAGALFFLIGYLAYLLPFVMAYHGWLIYRQRKIFSGVGSRSSWQGALIHWSGFFMTLSAACALASMYVVLGDLPAGSGGALGKGIAFGFEMAFSRVGGTVLLLAALFSGFTIWTGFSWLAAADTVGRWTWNFGEWLYEAVDWVRDYRKGLQNRQERQEKLIARQKKKRTRAKVRVEPRVAVKPDADRKIKEAQSELRLFETDSGELPPLRLLDPPLQETYGYSESEIEEMKAQIEIKLEEFGVGVAVVNVIRGPVVTRFELEPEAGVKGSKISGYAKDLARALSVVSVRVVEVVEGKSVIGLEVPNEDRETVKIQEILGSQVFNQSSSLLTLALGKAIDGEAVVCDLAKMPHLLVAGTTGSGKSVAINAMIVSLLYKAEPTDLRLIMIDPKMLELKIYDQIPHLLAPVITDMKKAARSLQWCVTEMERRYAVMSKLGVRNLSGYNRQVEDEGGSLKDPLFEGTGEEGEEVPTLGRLPHVVVVIDEFADMIMTVGKAVEDYIIRLAQKARAAGIHLILATQRPTRDVITGLIKSNIPSRISFRVASNVDSRVILDQVGAEQLLGQGDMLFLGSGSPSLMRVHGAFISIDEVGEVVTYLRQHGGEPHYLEAVTEEPEADLFPGVGIEDDEDDLYQDAVEVVLRDRKASISYLQRRLKIGYNRAASMVERMEEDGIVSPVQPGGGREILGPELDEDEF